MNIAEFKDATNLYVVSLYLFNIYINECIKDIILKHCIVIYVIKVLCAVFATLFYTNVIVVINVESIISSVFGFFLNVEMK